MNIYIVIPAHNEEDYIALMVESIANQTYLPKKVVVVNDNSTDNTTEIISKFTGKYDWIKCINIISSTSHIPGSKVIRAFNQGLETLDDHYDIICKFDADIILPDNYLEKLVALFTADKKIGIAGGLAFIENDGNWVYETVSSKDHVRGPFKAYRKDCFKQIEGLKESIGWDTADVLLAQYYGWKVKTDKSLHVKHLKPTGKSYQENTKFLFGEALHKMRYGFILTFLSAFKSGINKGSFSYFFNTLKGYFKAKSKNVECIVTEDQGVFIRKLRWRNIVEKIF